MRIYSSSTAKFVAFLVLCLTTVCYGKKASYYTEDSTTPLDAKSESEEKKSTLKPLPVPKDNIEAEESKNSYTVRLDPKKHKGSKLYQGRKRNETDKNYDFVQWYATPSRVVEHHVEGENLESKTDTFGGTIDDKSDYNGPSSPSYDEDHSYNQHDDHYHVDHHNDHSGADETPSSYTSYKYNNEELNNDTPTSDVFYKKMKLKKVRRNCTRSKTKKIQGWPDRSDTVVHSRSNDVPEISNYELNSFPQTLPALPEVRFNDATKPFSYPDISGRTFGFSGEHLHGIPRTHFFQYKNGEGVNHYHLHNHHHIYDANGKRINLDHGPTYRNLVEHFGKLKAMLTSKDSGSPYHYPHLTNNYRSTLTLGNAEPITESGSDDSQKRGYHYTGPHESYGRKTYKRAYPRTKISSLESEDYDKTIGMEMFRYGAGQYGTDEFSSNEEKGRYPNEVSYGADKSYPNSGEIYEPVKRNPSQDFPNREYNPDSSSGTPYSSYNSNFESSYSKEEKDDKYNNNYAGKAPYEPQEKAPYVPQSKAPYVPQSKAPYVPQNTAPYVPQNNAPYGPPTHLSGTMSGDYQGGYSGPASNGPRQSDQYPTPFSHTDGKSGSSEQTINNSQEPGSAENPVPPTVDVTHSVSYSQDGELDTINYGPENLHLYQNLRPDPDPLTIPKNARVFEHHIRLHPMHYMFSAMGRTAMNYPVPYNNALYPAAPLQNYPVPLPKYPVPLQKYPVPLPKYPVPLQKYPVPLQKYPVPLHKLIPNPLKMPFVPAAPIYQRYPNPHLNQMLQAYQSRSLHHRWW